MMWKDFGSPRLHPGDQLHPALEHVLGTRAATSPSPLDEPPPKEAPTEQHLSTPTHSFQPPSPAGKAAVSFGSRNRLHLAPSTRRVIQAAPGKSSPRI